MYALKKNIVLLPKVQFKKREKQPRRRVTLTKFTGFLKVTLLRVCFSRFLNCTNGAKLRNASYMTVFS